MSSLFDEMGGEEACTRLSDLFHDLVERDPELRPLFPRAFESQRERLAWFLAEALGGPSTYTARREKNSLLCRHAHLRIGPREIDLWLGHMQASVERLGLTEELTSRLQTYFRKTAPTMGDPLLPYYDLSIPELEELLAQQPEMARTCEVGRTLLAHAAAQWDLERVELLLKHGADVHAKDLTGHDALYRAANALIRGREVQGRAVVELLLRSGAHVNGVTGPKRVTPLHMAARRGNIETARALIAAGADLGARDSNGVTPLQRAINCRQKDVATLLERAVGGVVETI